MRLIVATFFCGRRAGEHVERERGRDHRYLLSVNSHWLGLEVLNDPGNKADECSAPLDHGNGADIGLHVNYCLLSIDDKTLVYKAGWNAVERMRCVTPVVKLYDGRGIAKQPYARIDAL